MSRILFLYLTRIFVLLTVQVLLIFVSVYSVIDMMEVRSFVSVDNIELWRLYINKIPMVISHVLPLSVTVGGVLSIAFLYRNGEWNAFLASGISAVSLLGVMIFSTLLFTVLHFFIVNTIAPLGMQKFEQRAKLVSRQKSQIYLNNNRIVLNRGGEDNNSVVIIDRENGQISRFCVVDKVDKSLSLCWNHVLGWDAEVPKNLHVENGVDVPVTGADGILGASVTTAQLVKMSKRLKLRGLDTRGVDAQLLLRQIMVLFCFTVPVFIWLLAGVLGWNLPVKMVFLGVAGSASFWGVLVVAWSGSVLGAFPITSIYFAGGLSLVLSLVTGAVFLRRLNPYSSL